MNRYIQSAVTALLFLVSSSAFAYIGPGSGLSAIGTVIALVGAIIMMIVGFMWYPLKRLLKKNSAVDDAEESPVTSAAPGGEKTEGKKESLDSQ